MFVGPLSGSNVNNSGSLSLSVLGGGTSNTGTTVQTTSGNTASNTSRAPSSNTPSSGHRAVSSGGTTPATPSTTRIVGFATNAETPRNTRDRENGKLRNVTVFYYYCICIMFLI